MNKYFIISLILIAGIVSVAAVHFAKADSTPTVCCEKTTAGFYCQDVPTSQCAAGSRQVPTACSSTSFCNPGVCYDSKEGTCATNTPQVVCNANNGTWSAVSPPQCQLGCCVLGDQAAFVTLTRCKLLSSQLGLQTNYDKSITDEAACVLSVKGQDEGACVYESDYQKTCKVTTRAECGAGINGTASTGTFYSGKLCTAEELGTNCAPTDKTTCVPGKDGVYFVDSCGNPANIYDATKLKDTNYWTDIQAPSASCGAGGANANSPNCGNCNYLQGSFCRDASAAGGRQPTYGTNICADLNCANTQNGNSYKHGESWCVYNDKGSTDNGNNAVGSGYFKHICENGQEVVEACADFRQETCIQSSINTSAGSFSQAACRVNRWQDCTAQTSKADCVNTDKRDCLWIENISFGNSTTQSGACVPQNSPGLQFWQGSDAQQICSQANAQCIVTFQKSLLGGGNKCVNNCDCLTPQWKAEHVQVCTALGDCGPKINWLGNSGYNAGYNLSTSTV